MTTKDEEYGRFEFGFGFGFEHCSVHCPFHLGRRGIGRKIGDTDMMPGMMSESSKREREEAMRYGRV